MIKQSGELDRRITIQSYTTTTDAFGQKTKSFGTLASVWAKVVEKVGDEGENGDMISATKRVDFFIRFRSDINEQMRITYNSKTYKIHAIQSADARQAYQMIRCEYTDAA